MEHNGLRSRGHWVSESANNGMPDINKLKHHFSYSYITILSPEDNFDSKGKAADGVDLRTLRAIRVLRPLKLVSGVPSKP